MQIQKTWRLFDAYLSFPIGLWVLAEIWQVSYVAYRYKCHPAYICALILFSAELDMGWLAAVGMVHSFLNTCIVEAIIIVALIATASVITSLSRTQQAPFGAVECAYSNCNLAGSCFRQAVLVSCRFSSSDLTQAVFRSGRLNSCNFNSSTLRGAIFFAARIQKCDFALTLATDCKYDRAVIVETSFNNADLKRSMFRNSRIKSCSFQGADLSGTDFTGAIFDNVTFDGATCDTSTKWPTSSAPSGLSRPPDTGNMENDN
jgi:hypothetical protein